MPKKQQLTGMLDMPSDRFVNVGIFSGLPADLRKYVAESILPRYDNYDKAHSRGHIRGVMLRSMELYGDLASGKMSWEDTEGKMPSEVQTLNPAMIFTIAAYHDIGVCEGREFHHIVSGKMLMEDEQLRTWFSPEQMEQMKIAVEDHRASNNSWPRTIYGRIVSEADKEIDIDTIISRTILYGLANHPELSPEEHKQRSYDHLLNKYGDAGYLRLQFKESKNARNLEELRSLIRNKDAMAAELSKFEMHPLQPFVPKNAKVLLLGSFPPPHARWSMEFFYPNFQNDMWRIMGHLFFGDRNHFTAACGKGFDYDKVVVFCTEQGIALYDAAMMVKRLKGNASDNFLKIIVPTDIQSMLRSMPECRAVVSTGGKSAEQIAAILGCDVPAVGADVSFELTDSQSTFEALGIMSSNQPDLSSASAGQKRTMRFFRMPSSSRAYPMPLESKAAHYARLFEFLK